MSAKTSEMKRTRRDRGEMEGIMFKLFEGQPNWTLRQLIQETDQPEVCLWIFMFSISIVICLVSMLKCKVFMVQSSSCYVLKLIVKPVERKVFYIYLYGSLYAHIY